MRPKNPAEDMGRSYGPWRDNVRRDRHPYTSMEASKWMEICDRLRLVTDSGGVYTVPKEGRLIIRYKYYPRCATPIECLNATGMKRLIQLLSQHRKNILEILRVCQYLVLESYQVDDILSHFDGNIERQTLLEIFTKLIICCRDTR